MVTTHAGRSTAGTTVAATNVLNGMQLVKMKLATGSGSRILALRVKMKNGKPLLINLKFMNRLQVRSKPIAPTAHAESYLKKTKSTTRQTIKLKKSGSMVSGSPTMKATETKVTSEKAPEATEEASIQVLALFTNFSQ